MNKSESIYEFYARVPQVSRELLPENKSAGVGHFNVFARDACSFLAPYSRRDFFKVSYIIGKGRLYFADQWIYIDKPALLLSNPKVPYAWEAESKDQKGWFCLFTDSFLNHDEKFKFFQQTPLFQTHIHPVFFPDEAQQQEISAIFKRMLAEINSDYLHKYDVLRSYLHVLVHEALKIQPPETFVKHKDASARITQLFLELLERQFPIDTPEFRLQLHTPKEFATCLSVHINHLNRSVKKETGKTTGELIAARILGEGKALLQHSNWSVSEIAYSLGFESPAYFTNFFKKNQQQSPLEYRKNFV
ncbi:helix-turn-helix domain-containing protein [Sphingobacterium spiritivorum]|uniref:helix-turn-helix domain-containing protein n=1 Tax=Sphingobacterium spiritivorum TaxID=258 RepID=UPI003DA3D94B